MNNDDKRSVFTDALETLGHIITENEKRDAIHLAVEPVIAKQTLHPGQDIGADGSTTTPYVGIVDPFLKNKVMEGERFWLVIYPRQIKSLRHVWTHPAFSEEVLNEKEINADDNKKKESIKWMEDYVRKLNKNSDNDWSYSTDYDEMLQAGHEYLDHGEYLIKGGLFDGVDFDYNYWTHFSIITGREVDSETNSSSFF